MTSLPVPPQRFIEHVAANPSTAVTELLQPFKQHEDELRKVFAQEPEHPAVRQLHVVPVFAGHEQDVKIRARNLDVESDGLKESYIMPLKASERKPNDALAIADSLQHFKTNFNLFTESSLADLDWNNVVVAGSAVVTSLLSVPEQHAQSKRSLRRFYHEVVAPASDVDLFLYDLTEEQAIEKIKQIERNVRDALLVETTTIRTKNTITIVSQYPVRHVQIVLRIYKSITEILTGFDVDCSCAAYDGQQVWASPRAIAAYMTQTNTLDLTRRSPSYENRLSKYRHRGFEVKFPELDRSRIDPTIYERSFFRTQGLARLLILEKLPKSSEREAYIDQRRMERGRPAADRSRMRQHLSRGDIKSKWEDEVAEWVDSDEVSSYHTFTIPYGPKYHARKIEKLLYTKDLLLNAEWNKPKDREVNLHRHPAFFGSVNDVIGDCCGHCPTPITVEEEGLAEQESKTYVNGTVTFMKDDCGGQTIGSFNPLSPDEYTDMAYVGNTELLCHAIVEQDLHYVDQWLRQDGNDANTRDHTGRCPLHLAVSYSSLEIVQCLIDHGARLVARLVDGKTALHLACLRGDPAIVSALLRKSESNEEDELRKTDARRKLRMEAKGTEGATSLTQDSTFEMIDMPECETDIDAVTENSMVRVKDATANAEGHLDGEIDNAPDVYDVNVLGWDTPTSPLHLAILSGHQTVVECLVQDFGANVLLPVVLPAAYAGGPSQGALLSLTLAFTLPLEEAKDMTRLLFRLGASSAQADVNQKTALEYCITNQPRLLETYLKSDSVGIVRAIKHISIQPPAYRPTASGPLIAAISNHDVQTALRLLNAGARPDVPFEAYLKGIEKTAKRSQFETEIEQPVICAIEHELPLLSGGLVEQYGIDSNTLTTQGWRCVHDTFGRGQKGQSILDLVNEKIKLLREWKHEKPKCDPPIPLEEDSSYLHGFAEGTYQHSCAMKQLESAKLRYEKDWKSHVQELGTSADREVGLEQKQAAIFDKLDEFRKLEAILTSRSAKTFKELHPEVEEREELGFGNRFDYGDLHPRKSEPFKVAFGYNVAVPSDEVRLRYVRLFEATWTGDIKTVKELTLVAWTNDEGEKCPPLQIAVQDDQKHSPFYIAVLNGAFDLAKMILDIAAVQYAPPDAPQAQRYHVAADSEDEEDECNSDYASDEETDLPIATEAINDNPTIENIGEVSLSVKSNVKPVDMIYWSIPKHSARLDQAPCICTNAHWCGSDTLIELALARDNLQLLKFLLDLVDEYASKAEASNVAAADTNNGDMHNRYISLEAALGRGKPHMLAEFIKRTAIGVSIDKLALEHGASDTIAKSKYYQGLSVNGAKRKDWANAGRRSSGVEESGSQVSPLLVTAYHGTLEQMEWMLSDAPLRCYRHFASTHQDDKMMQRISGIPGGFEAAVKALLDSRTHLAIHCCIAGRQTTDRLEMLKYLIEALPEALEARSADQLTPLLQAFRLHHLEAAKILINAGADQMARDKDGMNLIHQLVAYNSYDDHEDIARMRNMIDTIDTRLVSSMFLQRCSAKPGALTPIALWLARIRGSKDFQVGVTRLILEHSEGCELAMLNGEGLTALHTVARMSSSRHGNVSWHLELAEVLLECRPELAVWENATGQTTLEMVETILLGLKCSLFSGGDEEMSRRSRYLTHSYYGSGRNKVSIVDLAPRYFVEEESDDSNDSSGSGRHLNLLQQESYRRQRSELMRKLLTSAQTKLDAEGRGRRRLVTLNEASEVARRLAAMQRKRVEKEDEEVAEHGDGRNPPVDLVEQWFSRALRCAGPVESPAIMLVK